MKKKVEISIIWVIFYIILLLFVSGLLVYKTFFEKPSREEIPIETKKEETIQATPERKKEKAPVIEQKPDTLKILVEEEIPDTTEVIAKNIEIVTETKSPEELGRLRIPQTRSLFNLSSSSYLANLPEGKIYYDGSHGKLESQVIYGEKEISEKLIATNFNGEIVSELEIGLMDENREVKKYALISRNKISVFERTSSDNKNGKQEEQVTDYTITPELKFMKGKTYTKVL